MNYLNFLHYLNREPGFRFTAEKKAGILFSQFSVFRDCSFLTRAGLLTGAGSCISVQAKSSKKSLDKLFKHRYNNKAVRREGLKLPGSTCSYAAIAQPVERILGKDEVPGSNPGSSSMKNPT